MSTRLDDTDRFSEYTPSETQKEFLEGRYAELYYLERLQLDRELYEITEFEEGKGIRISIINSKTGEIISETAV